MIDWLQRLGKWRIVFTGWQLGTRPKGDPESDAVRDHRELSMLLRAETSALTRLLIEKKIFTEDEIYTIVQEEAKYLCEAYERRFPGFKATDNGIAMDTAVVSNTMRGWRP